MDCSTPGFPVHHRLPEPTQTHVHQVADAIQPSRPLSPPSPQSCPTLCNPVDCSPPGSSVHGVLQAGILEWVAVSFSGGIFQTQGSNRGLLPLRQILYQLSYQGSPEINYSLIFKSMRVQLSSFTDLFCCGQSLLGKLGIRGCLDRHTTGELERGVELFLSAELGVVGVRLAGEAIWAAGESRVAGSIPLLLMPCVFSQVRMGTLIWLMLWMTPVSGSGSLPQLLHAPGWVGPGFLPKDDFLTKKQEGLLHPSNLRTAPGNPEGLAFAPGATGGLACEGPFCPLSPLPPQTLNGICVGTWRA